MIKQPYEAPSITPVGTVKDLTQAQLFGANPDGLTVVTISVGGVTLNIPGDGTLPPGAVIIS